MKLQLLFYLLMALLLYPGCQSTKSDSADQPEYYYPGCKKPQKIKQQHLNHFFLKGKVKRIEADSDKKVVFEFNKDGYLVSKTTRRGELEFTNQTIKRNEKNQILLDSTYSSKYNDAEKKEWIWWEVNRFRYKGNQINYDERKNSNGSHLIKEYEFDSDGCAVKLTTNDLEEKEFEETLTFYDHYKRVTEIHDTYPKIENDTIYKWKFIYENGRLQKMESYKNDEKSKPDELYSYDEKGQYRYAMTIDENDQPVASDIKTYFNKEGQRVMDMMDEKKGNSQRYEEFEEEELEVFIQKNYKNDEHVSTMISKRDSNDIYVLRQELYKGKEILRWEQNEEGHFVERFETRINVFSGEGPEPPYERILTYQVDRKYDDQGNWIEETYGTFSNGVKIDEELTRRKITYWEE